jgi:hypothetical protein
MNGIVGSNRYRAWAASRVVDARAADRRRELQGACLRCVARTIRCRALRANDWPARWMIAVIEQRATCDQLYELAVVAWRRARFLDRPVAADTGSR